MTAVVVAHPGDEVFYFWDAIKKGGVDIFVVCEYDFDFTLRKSEALAKSMGNKLIRLNLVTYPALPLSKDLDMGFLAEYESVYTHNRYGEYGNAMHSIVNNSVRRVCPAFVPAPKYESHPEYIAVAGSNFAYQFEGRPDLKTDCYGTKFRLEPKSIAGLEVLHASCARAMGGGEKYMLDVGAYFASDVMFDATGVGGQYDIIHYHRPVKVEAKTGIRVITLHDFELLGAWGYQEFLENMDGYIFASSFVEDKFCLKYPFMKDRPTMVKPLPIYAELTKNENSLSTPCVVDTKRFLKGSGVLDYFVDYGFTVIRPFGFDQVNRVLDSYSNIVIPSEVEETFCYLAVEAKLKGMKVIANSRSGFVAKYSDYVYSGNIDSIRVNEDKIDFEYSTDHEYSASLEEFYGNFTLC